MCYPAWQQLVTEDFCYITIGPAGHIVCIWLVKILPVPGLRTLTLGRCYTRGDFFSVHQYVCVTYAMKELYIESHIQKQLYSVTNV